MGTTNLCVTLLAGMSLLCASANLHAETKFRGLTQVQFVDGDNLTSFLNEGTGLLRHDQSDDVVVAHTMLELNQDLVKNLKLTAVLNHVRQPETFTNFTQLFVKYKPIWSAKYRWQFRAGMFYPEMGFENPDIGWLSPFNYTNSAINTWIGEELRTIGTEFKLTRPGRAHGSKHSYSFTGAIYKGNDPTGTLLAWRGWGLHDRQTLLNETVPFANFPSIGPGFELEPQENFVEPFREIDGRFGYYFGAHWDYQKKSRLRYYYYNNNADETVLAREGQYAWHTIFHSLAWQYRFNKQWRLITQYMDGNTAMGPGAVNVDFNAWFVMLSYRLDKQHRITARIDDFKTRDRDRLAEEDNNNGGGESVTLSYRYTLDKHWQFGLEYLYTDSFQANRAQFGLNLDHKQQQLMGVAQFRF